MGVTDNVTYGTLDGVGDTLALVRHLTELGALEIELHPDGSLYRVRFGARAPQVHPIAQRIDENMRRQEQRVSTDEELRKLHERTAFAATEGVR